WDLRFGPTAQDLVRCLRERGASFFADSVNGTHHLSSEVEEGLWELASAGIVTADGFDNLRALLDPRRRAGRGSGRTKRPRHSVGRWSLLQPAAPAIHMRDALPAEVVEAVARQLLRRYG